MAFAPRRDGAALLVTTSPQHRGLSAADVTIAGKVVRSSAITRRFIRDAIAASNQSGTTAVAWLTSRLPQQLRIRVRRRDGGAFEPARTIASFAREGAFGGADVAVGPRGEIAVIAGRRAGPSSPMSRSRERAASGPASASAAATASRRSPPRSPPAEGS